MSHALDSVGSSLNEIKEVVFLYLLIYLFCPLCNIRSVIDLSDNVVHMINDRIWHTHVTKADTQSPVTSLSKDKSELLEKVWRYSEIIFLSKLLSNLKIMYSYSYIFFH